ncbi:hypothetical protein A33M_1554 [Rhodovulum sp. PH10]|nr:hypothetical protein A33M_1554 [Rhodovulum sp. PH10]
MWLEGVDFDATLTDTNDLSTIRGGSFTLLDAFVADQDPDRIARAPWRLLPRLHHVPGVSADLVFAGASQGLFRLDGSEQAVAAAVDGLKTHLSTCGLVPEKTSSGTPRKSLPLAHMRWVTGLAPIDGTGEAAEAAALRTAHFRARRTQMEDTAARRPVVPADRICRVGRTRPADDEIEMPWRQAADYGVDVTGLSADDRAPVPVSAAVKARKAVGRYARWCFHQDKLGWPADWRDEFGFVDHFQQMIAEPYVDPKKPTMREAVSGKLAVFYADGNDFTKIRTEMGGSPDAFARFSHEAARLQEAMLRRIVDDTLVPLAGDPDPQVWRLAATGRLREPDDEEERSGKRWLRFETLLYGGDEICWVAPAWLGMLLAARTFEAIRGATIEDPHTEDPHTKDKKLHPLTIEAALVFAPVKMPIATARALAKDLADSVKCGKTNRLGIHAFESVEPPMGGLAALRKRLIGDEQAFPAAHRALALDGDAFPALVEKISALKLEGRLPRSQLYRLLRAAARTGVSPEKPPRLLGDPEAGRQAHLIFERYCRGAESNTGEDDLLLLRSDDPSTPRSDLAAVNAWFLTHVWDYVDPTGDGTLDPARALGRPS